MTPFRSEKNTNWEGAFRIPLLVRWPGKIKAGSVSNEHRPASRLAADLPRDGRRARRRREAEEGLQGDRPHLQEPHRRLQPAALPDRRGEGRARASSSSTSATTATCSACATTTGSSCSWSSAATGTMQVWAEPFTRLRLPKLFNLRTDPYEFADVTSNTYYDWFLYNAYFIYAAQAVAAKFADDVQGVPADPEAEHLHHRRRAGEDADEAVAGVELTAMLASWNDGAAKSAIVDFVARVTQGRRAGLRPARRAHRDLRQRRHAVVRAADAGAGLLPDRPGEAACGEGSVAQGAPAVQGVPRARP